MSRARFTVTESAPDSEEGRIVEEGLTLRDAVGLMDGCADEPDSDGDKVRWLTHFNYTDDWRTGRRTDRALHIPKGVTNASSVRIARLLGVRE